METERRILNTRVAQPTLYKNYFQSNIEMDGDWKFEMDEENPLEASYSIVPILNKDKDRIINFLQTFFFRDEPLNVAIGLLDEPTPTCPELDEFCVNCIPDGLSLMAVSPSGCIMGVCLNGITRRENYENSNNFDDCANPKFKKILQLLSTISKRADVFGRFPNVDKVLEIVILSVDESYRGQGICKALIERTRDLAKEHNFPLIKVDCSSHYSGKAVSRLGFQSIYTLTYADYVDANGEPIFKTKAPHLRASTYVLQL